MDARFHERSSRRISGRAPAKINLFLEVTGKRLDGYHDLVSVLHEIDLCDEITLELAPKQEVGRGVDRGADQLELHGIPLEGPPSQNLALRAVRAYREHVRDLPPVSIRIVKHIPPGSGMGGGSSDAAWVLTALQELIGAPAGTEQLSSMARPLGSDVPFFLSGESALCTGRGEFVEPLSGIPSLKFLLAQPDFSLGTTKVYASLRLTEKKEDVKPLLVRLREDAREGTIDCFNRLTDAAAQVEPKIRVTLADLQRRTGLCWNMTGSGSVLFLVSRSDAFIESVRQRLEGSSTVKILSARSFRRRLNKSSE